MDTLVLDPLRIVDARQHYRRCMLCEHRCGANRLVGQTGPCKAGPVARLFRHRVEYGEELDLVPSHLFYLSGCDLRCVFCIAGINAFDPARASTSRKRIRAHRGRSSAPSYYSHCPVTGVIGSLYHLQGRIPKKIVGRSDVDPAEGPAQFHKLTRAPTWQVSLTQAEIDIGEIL